MAKWHGYFVVERGAVGINNWNHLIQVFEEMGTHKSPMPARNTHWRTRLDGDAGIYESAFESGEVGLKGFKELLAAEFDVPVEDIQAIASEASYAGGFTRVWEYHYPIGGDLRFTARRFGGGAANWGQSRLECLGYLALYQNEWEEAE